MERRLPLFPLFAIAITLLYVSARWAVDAWWFASLGRTDVYLTLRLTEVIGALVGASLLGGAVFTSARAAARNARNRPRATRAAAPSELGVRVGVWAATALGALWGASARDVWLLAWGRRHVGSTDPIFGLDLSFHLFVRPAIAHAHQLALMATASALLAAVVTYASRGAVAVVMVEGVDGPRADRLRVDAGARRHLAVLVGALCVLAAVGRHLARYDVLLLDHPLMTGPGWTATHVELPLLTLSAFAWLLAGVGLFQAIDRLRVSTAALALLPLALVTLLQSIVPPAAQRLLVRPNELAREEPFLSAHLHSTRRAWGLDAVEEATLTGDASLSLADLDRHRTTLDGIRLWDHERLLDTLRQVQEIRNYYTFPTVDSDRYVVDGSLRQTMLAAREFDVSDLPALGRTWVNERLVYTHGYGVALAPSNEFTSEGLPELWVKDLPPAVTHPDPLRIDRPQIYFGERTTTPAIVGGHVEEFDFPSGDANTTTRYAGKDGVVIGSLLHRLALAIDQVDLNLLVSTEVTAGSRILLHREVTDRVHRLAPFLWVDEDPTLVIADGKLVWIVEAYTTSLHYPYAAHRRLPHGPWVNYVRNSVKATVDAYDGTVTLYRMDIADPLADVWAGVYPGLLRPLSELPETLRAHLRYPLPLLAVQTDVYLAYHATNARTFYFREDQWAVPQVPSGRVAADGTAESAPMLPYYTVMRLPGEAQDEFVSMIPLTPPGKANLAAWVAARSDGDAYGTLRVYRFPKDRLVYGPAQVIARTSQDAEISQQLTLWSQGTSRAPRGAMLVIPIEKALLYVQPLYLTADHGSMPELKRVIVGYEDRIVMATSLDDGLARVLDRGPVAPTMDDTDVDTDAEDEPDAASVPDAAKAHWRAANEAARAGDWARFGAEMDALGKVIEALDADDD